MRTISSPTWNTRWKPWKRGREWQCGERLPDFLTTSSRGSFSFQRKTNLASHEARLAVLSSNQHLEDQLPTELQDTRVMRLTDLSETRRKNVVIAGASRRSSVAGDSRPLSVIEHDERLG